MFFFIYFNFFYVFGWVVTKMISFSNNFTLKFVVIYYFIYIYIYLYYFYFYFFFLW